MSAHDIVSRLESCRPAGNGKWMARCPAHADKGPSLSIRDVGDGRTLLHCFAGCGANDVLTAIGLELSDLYPPSDNHFEPLARGWQQMKREGPAVDSIKLEMAHEPGAVIEDREEIKRLILAGVKPSSIRPMIKAEAEKGQSQMVATLEKLRNNLPLDKKDHAVCRFAYPDPGPLERELRRRYITRIREESYTLEDALSDIEWKLCNQIPIHEVDREILEIAGERA